VIIDVDVTTDEGISKITHEAGKINIRCNKASASDFGPWQSISIEK
jgi:hypothetical protein